MLQNRKKNVLHVYLVVVLYRRPVSVIFFFFSDANDKLRDISGRLMHNVVYRKYSLEIIKTAAIDWV